MLKEKVALITGASRGIGKEIAEIFAKNGASLIINSKDEKKLQTVADELNDKYKVEITPVAFDVSSYDEIKNAFKKIYKITKRLDIVVNSAGILEAGMVGLISKDSVERSFATNVYSVLYISQYSSRLMSRQKSGSIINMSSIMGLEGREGLSLYSGTKAALIGITKSLSKELAPFNIRVNAIAPGFIDTDMTNSLPDEQYQKYLDSIGLKRVGTPKNVADAALFLASELSEYITGEIIRVDGGMRV